MHPLFLACVVASGQPGVKPDQGTKPRPGAGAPVAPVAPAKGEPASGGARSAVAFPHPLITEVLFAVPSGEAGDANKDGTRQVAGDEFVELVNPHEQVINLGGYTLSDMNSLEKSSSGKAKGSAVRWAFPPVSLQPGEVAVVFNGNASTIPGPVGDATAAPSKGNDAFGGALVFSMRQPSDRVAFANTGDWVMLTAPDGKVVHLIKWGEPRLKVPAGVGLVEDAPTARAGSVQRVGVSGSLAAHPNDGKVAFSPGVFAVPPSLKAEEAPKRPPAEKPAAPAGVKPEEEGPVKRLPGKDGEPVKKPRY